MIINSIEHGQFQASKLKPERLQAEEGMQPHLQASVILLCMQLTCEWGEGREQSSQGNGQLWERNLGVSQGQSGVYFKKCKRNRESSLFTKKMCFMYEHLLTPPEQGQMYNHWWNRKSRKVRTSH